MSQMMREALIVAFLALVLLAGACRDGSGDGDGGVDDGGGDADTDTDSDTDTDGDGDCRSAHGVCNPVSQCGCSAGQMCEANLDPETFVTVELCVESSGGSGGQGDVCTEAPCAPGFSCRQWATPEGDPTAVCRKWCVEDADCSDFPGSECNDYLSYILPDESTATIEPYALCSPEDVGLGIGQGEFSICTGMPESCPGNPPWSYTIGGSDVNGRCSIEPGDPRLLTFSIRDVDQSVSITANELEFTPSGSDLVTATGGSRTRFSFFLPDRERPYSTTEIASPPTPGTCQVLIRYREAEAGFDIEYTCNQIEDTFTGEVLTTLEGVIMGAGTASMDGCDTEG